MHSIFKKTESTTIAKILKLEYDSDNQESERCQWLE